MLSINGKRHLGFLLDVGYVLISSEDLDTVEEKAWAL